MAQKKGLGKGINALFTEKEPEAMVGVQEIDINKIEPNKQQPRKYFDQEALRSLADSIKEFGIIQPLILKVESEGYSIIAGERRWRAARIAGLRTVPCLVKEYTEVETLQLALIENLQREDLNPIEEARCYKRLADDYFFSQDLIAEKVGRSRNAISRSISLLALDPRVQIFLIEGKLSSTHGTLLLTIEDLDKQYEWAERIIEEELSSREAERRIKAEQLPKSEKPLPNNTYSGVEDELKHIFGTKVMIRSGKKKGKIEIEYYSEDELDRLLGMFKQL